MNSATSQALRNYFLNHSFVQITDATCAIAVALLLAVLVEREILRMSRPESARRNIATFATIVVPTTVVFAAVIVDRFMTLS